MKYYPNIGEEYGWWIVLAERDADGYVLCRCRCGLEKLVDAANLCRGQSKHCSTCGRRQKYNVPTTHTPKVRKAADGAIKRCSPGGAYYERGIQVRFASVIEFVDYLLTLPGCHDVDRWLDRIDNDGHYEPGNLRWATISESQKNKRHRPRNREARELVANGFGECFV